MTHLKTIQHAKYHYLGNELMEYNGGLVSFLGARLENGKWTLAPQVLQIVPNNRHWYNCTISERQFFSLVVAEKKPLKALLFGGKSSNKCKNYTIEISDSNSADRKNINMFLTITRCYNCQMPRNRAIKAIWYVEMLYLPKLNSTLRCILQGYHVHFWRVCNK